MKKARLVTPLLLLLPLLSACAVLTSQGRDVHAANCYFRGEKYSEAVSMYRRAIRDYPQSSLSADARFGLAYTLAFYDNPNKDYAQALLEFDEFIKDYPDDVRVKDAQNFRHILKILYETKKDNERLKNSIEELRKLDIRHERQRRRR